jgi:hypothetical protein
VVCDLAVLHPPRAEDLTAFLHDTGTAGADKRPRNSSDINLSRLLSLECVFLSAGNLGWPDKSFLVLGK